MRSGRHSKSSETENTKDAAPSGIWLRAIGTEIVALFGPRRFRRFCLILAVAALGLRWVGLADRPLDVDEVFTQPLCVKFGNLLGELVRATKPIGPLFQKAGQPQPRPFGVVLRDSWKLLERRPPLSFVLIVLAQRIQRSQLMFLLPAALFGAATVGLLAWCGRVAFGCRVGILAGLLLLFSTLHIGYSQYGRYYPFVVFFAVWSYLLIEAWWRLRRWRYLMLWPVAATLALASHYFSAFVVAIQAMIITILIVIRIVQLQSAKKRLLGAALFATAAAVGLAGGLVVFFALNLDEMVRSQLNRQIRWATPYIDMSWAFWDPHLRLITGWPGGLWIALFLFATGMVTAWRRNRIFLVHAVALLIVPIAVVDYIQPDHWFSSKYVCFALPFYLTMLAVGVVTLWDAAENLLRKYAASRRPGRAVLTILALLAPFAAFCGYANQPTPRLFSDVARYIERVGRPGDLVRFGLVTDEYEFKAATTNTDHLRLGIPLKSWNELETFYAEHLIEPFWLVTARVTGRDRKKWEWALNNMGHLLFDRGFAFFSGKHAELDLSQDILRWRRSGPGSRPRIPPPPGLEAVRLSIFIPRTWHYYVMANQNLRDCRLRIDTLRPIRWVPLTTTPDPSRAKIWLNEGRHEMALVVPKGMLDRLQNLRIRMVPACGEEYSVNGAQFDLAVAMSILDTPITQRNRFGMRLRLWGVLSYPVYVEYPGRYRFSVTADNDRPTTNRIGLFINKQRVAHFYFNKLDNSIETKSTEITLEKGFQVITVRNDWYQGVDKVRGGPVSDSLKTTLFAEIGLKALDLPKRRPR